MMARRTLEFFMTRDEAATCAWAACEAHGFSLGLRTLKAGAPASYEIAEQRETFVTRTGEVATSAYFVPSSLKNEPAEDAGIGLVTLWIPRAVGPYLFMSHLACKSEWLHARTGEPEGRPGVLEEFKTVAKHFRPLLKNPVLANGKVVYRDIWYSPGAVRWVQQGGELRQGSSITGRPWKAVFTIPGGASA